MTTKSTLSVNDSCDFVISSVRNSFLNFSIQETPFSLYLTIRKSFSQTSSNSDKIFSRDTNVGRENSEVETLKIKLKAAEDSNMNLKKDYEEAVNDCEQCYDKINKLESKVEDLMEEINNREADKQEIVKVESEVLIKDKLIEKFQQEKNNLECDVENAEKNWKALNRTVKAKDKEIYDLKKENETIADNLVNVKEHFARANKEKKDEEKKRKKSDKKDFIEGLKAKSTSVALECNVCDVKVESWEHLKSHERMYHMKSNSVQTDVKDMEDKSVQYFSYEILCDKEVQTNDEKIHKIEKYPCFYCGINIVGQNHLNEHKGKCRGSSKMFGEVGLPPPVPPLPPLPSGFFSRFPPPPDIAPFGLSWSTASYY